MVDESIANEVGQERGQLRVGLAQPPAMRNAVRHILELVRGHFVEVVEHRLLEDLRVERRNTVHTVRCSHTQIRHTDNAIGHNGHIFHFAGIFGHVPDERAVAVVNFLDNFVNAREQGAEQVLRPTLEGFLHDGVVRIGKRLGDDLPGVVPAVAAFVEENAHHFGNAERRMRVVDMDGHLVRNVIQFLVVAEIPLHNVLNGRGHQEILLAEPQHFAFGMVVRRVEDLADGLGHGLLLHRTDVVALVEEAHVEAGGLGLPEAQDSNAVGVLAGNVHIIGDGVDRGLALHGRRVVAVAPVALYGAAKFDDCHFVGLGVEPDVAARQPEIRKLGLPAVNNLLFENAVLVHNAVAHGRVGAGGQTVQVAGGQTAEAAVAETGIRFALIEGLQLNAEILEPFADHVGQAEVVEIILEGSPEQEFHAEIIGLLGLGVPVQSVPEVVVFLRQNVLAQNGNGLVILLIGGLFRRHAENVAEL